MAQEQDAIGGLSAGNVESHLACAVVEPERGVPQERIGEQARRMDVGEFALQGNSAARTGACGGTWGAAGGAGSIFFAIVAGVAAAI